MLLGRAYCQFQRLQHVYCRRHLSSSSKGYYVLIPEMPTDTPETNTLLRLDGLPEFTKISESNIITGCSKLALEYDVEFGAITDRLSAGDSNFGTIFGAIEAHLAPLSCVLRLAEHLKNVDQRYQAPFWRIVRQVLKAKSSRWSNEMLFKAIQNNLSTNQHLSSIEKRLCEQYVLQCKLAGMDLSEKKQKQLLAAEQCIEAEQLAFRTCAVKSQNLFEQVVDHAAILGKAPRSLFYKLTLNPAEPLKGPWRITIQPDVYFELLRYCEDSQLRWNLWHAYVNRASTKHSAENLSNHVRIGKIRNFAMDRAKALGYKNPVEQELKRTMAGSFENVKNYLEKANKVIRPLAVEEVRKLNEFASTTPENFLMPWDVSFWRQKWHDSVYGQALENEDCLIPLEASLSGVFNLIDHLFGVRFERLPSHAAQPWHPTVAAYRAVDSDSERRVLGYVYLDLFTRPESGKCAGNWISLGREPSALLGSSSLSFVVMNLPKPLSGQPAFISPSIMLELVRLLGSSLPHMLCHNQFSELSAGLLVEPDFSPVCGNMLRFIVSDHPDVLRSVCSTLSETQLAALSASTYHMSSYDMAYQLFMSAFDLDLHTGDDHHWVEIMRKNWNIYLKEVTPLLEKDDHSPCGMAQIFCSPHFGMYYSLKWSEFVARDLVSAFSQSPSQSEDSSQATSVWSSAAVKETGRRIRRAIIEPGCLLTANDAFSRARGRDFSVDSALDQLSGVLKSTSTFSSK